MENRSASAEVEARRSDSAGPRPRRPRGDRPPPLPSANGRRNPLAAFLREPYVQLLGYYLLLLLVGGLLASYVPVMRHAFVGLEMLPVLEQAEQIVQGGTVSVPGTPGPVTMAEIEERTLVTLLVILGALALVAPVVGVYMRTKRLRYDASVVHSVIILPIVVTGILMIVKNSVALAFSLAGIVAAVRFRNNLKDPRDAVYIFLAMGIGLSAGVQALDVALATSFAFNLVVLTLWRFNVGSVYGGRYARTGVLSTGDVDLLLTEDPEQSKAIRRSMLEEARDMPTDGVLLVHAEQAELARLAVREVLSDVAKDWRLVRIVPRGEGRVTLQYLVRLKKKTSPADLIGELGERWPIQLRAAEYMPFYSRSSERATPVEEKSKEP
jgi:hypothetical protein